MPPNKPLHPFITSVSITIHLILILNLDAVDGCEIMGIDSGYCEYQYLPETYINETTKERAARKIAQSKWNCDDESCMPFCGKYLASYYPFCAPSPPAIAMFQNHTIRSKDRWIEEQVTSTIANRIAIETKGLGEDGQKAKKRFHKNRACQDAYKRYACWLNFPRCDEFEDSLPLCTSVCENFFRVCNYEEDLWRCSADSRNGNFFPGEPFQANEYEAKNPKEVCTPSVKGAGVTARMSFVVALCSILLLALLI
jgi:hypothetical protein